MTQQAAWVSCVFLPVFYKPLISRGRHREDGSMDTLAGGGTLSLENFQRLWWWGCSWSRGSHYLISPRLLAANKTLTTSPGETTRASHLHYDQHDNAGPLQSPVAAGLSQLRNSVSGCFVAIRGTIGVSPACVWASSLFFTFVLTVATSSWPASYLSLCILRILSASQEPYYSLKGCTGFLSKLPSMFFKAWIPSSGMLLASWKTKDIVLFGPIRILESPWARLRDSGFPGSCYTVIEGDDSCLPLNLFISIFSSGSFPFFSSMPHCPWLAWWCLCSLCWPRTCSHLLCVCLMLGLQACSSQHGCALKPCFVRYSGKEKMKLWRSGHTKVCKEPSLPALSQDRASVSQGKEWASENRSEDS